MAPKPRNAIVGSIATFTCYVIGDTVNWRINGEHQTLFDQATFDPHTITECLSDTGLKHCNSTLNVIAIAVTGNDTQIQCVAVSSPGVSAFSANVALRTQGMFIHVTVF